MFMFTFCSLPWHAVTAFRPLSIPILRSILHPLIFAVDFVCFCIWFIAGQKIPGPTDIIFGLAKIVVCAYTADAVQLPHAYRSVHHHRANFSAASPKQRPNSEQQTRKKTVPTHSQHFRFYRKTQSERKCETDEWHIL